jgi:quercetin dioxygenase-like cupin family protein
MAYRPSPRPSFDVPTAIRAADAVTHTWGDEDAGFVEDWIYVSSQRLHTIVFGLPPGGAFRHSEAFRTVFAADELLHVLQGTLVLANPETGEVVRAERGESVFFRRDTWHHGFSYGDEPLRVLEYFAPPPATGTSGAYAQTRPYLEQSVYAAEGVVGALAEARPPAGSLHLLRREDSVWRLDRGVLAGLLVSTEHLTVGTLTVPAGQASVEEAHDGEELVYVTRGELRVEAGAVAETLAPGDAFFLPSGVPHSYAATESGVAEAVFGVAPTYEPPRARARGPRAQGPRASG